MLRGEFLAGDAKIFSIALVFCRRSSKHLVRRKKKKSKFICSFGFCVWWNKLFENNYVMEVVITSFLWFMNPNDIELCILVDDLRCFCAIQVVFQSSRHQSPPPMSLLSSLGYYFTHLLHTQAVVYAWVEMNYNQFKKNVIFLLLSFEGSVVTVRAVIDTSLSADCFRVNKNNACMSLLLQKWNEI